MIGITIVGDLAEAAFDIADKLLDCGHECSVRLARLDDEAGVGGGLGDVVMPVARSKAKTWAMSVLLPPAWAATIEGRAATVCSMVQGCDAGVLAISAASWNVVGMMLFPFACSEPPRRRPLTSGWGPRRGGV